MTPALPIAVPASHNQQRIWYAYQLTAPFGEYQLPLGVQVTGVVDGDALGRALTALVARHAILRTTYLLEGERLLQQIHPTLSVPLHRFDSASWTADQRDARMQEFARYPFDLAHDAPIRLAHFQGSPTHSILVLVLHHIAVDTVAIAILFTDLFALYAAEQTGQSHPAPPAGWPYQEFAQWQAAMLTSPTGAQLRAYWRQQLAGPLPQLRLPTDAPYPPVQRYLGQAQGFALDPQLIQQLTTLAAPSLTLYPILVAAFALLLARYSGQTELLIGAPVSNRTRAEVIQSVGDFSDVIVLRVPVREQQTVAEFLAQLQRTVREGLFAADYPFDLLLSDLDYPRDPRRSPVYQVLFNMPQAKTQAMELVAPFLIPFPAAAPRTLAGLPLVPYYLGVLEAPVELSLDIWTPDGGYYGVFKYNRELFHAPTIARMVAHYQLLLAAMVADPSQRIGDLPMARDPVDAVDGLLPAPRIVWHDEATLALDRVETALLAQPAVVDCWVMPREVTAMSPQLDAYVVLQAPVELSALQAQLAAVVPPGFPPLTLTPVSHIPFTPTGHVDEPALRTLLAQTG